MGQRDDCGPEIQTLEKAISSFQSRENNANDIRLAAESLGFRYSTIVIIAGKIDCGLETVVIALLEEAAETIPPDVDPQIAENIRGQIMDIRKLPEEVLCRDVPDESDDFEFDE